VVVVNQRPNSGMFGEYEEMVTCPKYVGTLPEGYTRSAPLSKVPNIQSDMTAALLTHTFQ
jgi:hypothetical protein